MRTLWISAELVAASLLLLWGLALLPGGVTPATAAPPLALTPSPEPPTPTPEPPTPVPTATDTPAEPPTPTPPPPDRPTVQPTSTPTSAVPTSTPVPAPPDPGLEIADPYILKEANLSEARVGDFVEFTLTIRCTGNVPATDVVVVDPVPGFLTIFNATTTRGLIAVSGNTITITIGSVAPGETVTVRILTQVNGLAAPGENRNLATLTTSSATDDPSNNQSSVSLTAVPAPTPTATPPAPAAPSPTPTPGQGSGGPTPTIAPPSATSAPPAGGARRPTASAGTGVVPPELPSAGRADVWAGATLPLLAGLLAIVLGAALRRRSSR